MQNVLSSSEAIFIEGGNMPTSLITKRILAILILSISLVGQDSKDYPRSWLFSPGSDMRSGAENTTTLHYQFSLIEDQIIGTSWLSEETIPGKLLGVAGRTLKFSFLDMPLDYFTVVLLHEWYGHGSRYREFGISDVEYGYGWPPPYGEGHGFASHYSRPDEVSTQERLGIWIGGLESEQVLNRTMRQRWMLTGEQHYREGWLYFWSFQNIMAYVADAIDLVEGQSGFNDPQAYIFYLNADRGFVDLDEYPYTLDDLKRMNERSALDPFLWFSLYNNFINYLWGGRTSSSIPRLRFGQVEYLPAVHMTLTPFGVETHIQNYLVYDEVLYMLNFRFGDESYYRSWGGLGFLASYPFSRSKYSADLSIDVWKQPSLQLNAGRSVTDGGLGAAVSLRSYYQIPEANKPIKAIFEIGYKSAGFLEGYPLAASPILMIGLQI